MRELLPALAASIREATDALRTRDVRWLQQAVQRQQELTESIELDRTSAIEFLRLNQELSRQLASFSAVLTQSLRRSSQTIQALTSLTQAPESLYSLDTLPRR